MVAPVQWLLYNILQIYFVFVIANVILSWLVAFNVINTRNQFVYMVGNFLHKVTEPVMAPIRRVLPAMGGLDLSPIVVLLGIGFLQLMILRYIHF
ncbi:YggT family protein [Aestuariispira insulae]|uniref:YggT family protein n=2 Tax=Aestuariispira insulae TaxID=1461337 RepID=A0A3D9HES4_9PROT|nr:YggT family protein [Aestuariispira insulae]